MNPSRKFETTLVDEEAIKTKQGQREGKPLDVLDVERFKYEIQYWTAEKERYENPKNDTERMRRRNIIDTRRQIIDRNYDKFLDVDSKNIFQRTFLFWQIIYQSEDPYFKNLREEIKQTDPESKLILSEQRSRVKEALKDRVMPIQVWLGVLEEYNKVLIKFDKDLKEVTPRVRKYIASRFMENINPELEIPKTEEELMEVLDSVNLRVRDPLRSYQVIGTHSGGERTIDLDLAILLFSSEGEERISDETFMLIAHEELHALSSGQVVKHEITYTYDQGSKDETFNKSSVTRPQWSGLATSGFKVTRFTWLNEAMTETLASRLVGAKPQSYEKEIELLGLLLTKGRRQIDQKLLTNAYFEKRGYQAPDDEDEKHKFWKQFRQEVREAYDHDPQFLVKLDTLIQEKGVDKAIALLKKWDPEHPQNYNDER